jgi:UDP-N-acetylglucosamine 2-epimerase (non-hydrolysing)
MNGMSMTPLRVMVVAGARPNFMKIAPIIREFAADRSRFEFRIVHTGQHYDEKMSSVFFDQLGIPRPDVNLDVGSGSHAWQTGAVMQAFEPVLAQYPCDLVKRGVAVAHVEAGLRSGDRSMPEEINRILTDQISDLLFTTERSAAANLEREGIPAERVHFVGNVMIDTLLAHRDAAAALRTHETYGVSPRAYVLMTLHRPSNVDDPETFGRLMTAIERIAQTVPVLFPVHPRTRQVVMASAVANALVSSGRLRLLEPLGYFEFLSLMLESVAVMTDSGGIQEETTVLRIPCLTLRWNTERPATVTDGTNQIVGTDPARIIGAWQSILENQVPPRVPEGWDGQAAARIAEVLRQWRR